MPLCRGLSGHFPARTTVGVRPTFVASLPVGDRAGGGSGGQWPYGGQIGAWLGVRRAGGRPAVA